jgi:hypothetical protein
MVAGAPATIAAAIEVPHGPIVEALLATGITVFAINPKQVDRFRDRYTVNGAKDDCRDAYVIAPSLSTDMQAFKKLTPEGPFTIRVRELSRTLDDLDRERRRPSNQLRELLFRYFPAMLQLSRPLMTPGCGRCLQSHPCRPKRSVSRYHALKRFLKHTGSGGLAPEVRIALQRECLDVTPIPQKPSQNTLALCFRYCALSMPNTSMCRPR